MEAWTALLGAPRSLLPWCALAFAAGSIPFGLIVALAFGKTDVRKAGSGNIGATNVARVAGRRLGLLTLILDAAKGFAPTFAARLAADAATSTDPGLQALALRAGLVGLCALLGHCFTPWLRFRGGKGVATGLGVMLALLPGVAGYGLIAFAVAFAATRIASIASLTAVVVVLIALLWLPTPATTLVPVAVCLAVIVVRHADNIRRLARRKEPTL
jgi:glycerol-3-phosphate acyltransferase PlsY